MHRVSSGVGPPEVGVCCLALCLLQSNFDSNQQAVLRLHSCEALYSRSGVGTHILHGYSVVGKLGPIPLADWPEIVWI